MATIPSNLSLIREDFRKPRSLGAIKADLAAAPTDYVMLVGLDDQVDVAGPLTQDVHYLTTKVSTRRAVRYTRPELDFDPLLLIQFNYIGSPIFRRSLVPLFPEASLEPWHTLLVRAHLQGASFSRLAGTHTIIEPWPRPELAGVYAHFRTSFDPAAVMEAVPTVQVEEINLRPFYSLKDPRAGSMTAFCRNCSHEFLHSLAALNVQVRTVGDLMVSELRRSGGEYVAWFDGIQEACRRDALLQLQIALEFPGVTVASPRLVTEFSLASYHAPAFWLTGGIHNGFAPEAWFTRTRDLGPTPPEAGYTTSHAILRKTT